MRKIENLDVPLVQTRHKMSRACARRPCAEIIKAFFYHFVCSSFLSRCVLVLSLAGAKELMFNQSFQLESIKVSYWSPVIRTHLEHK